MDLSLIIFIVVVAFFSYRGFRRGLLRSLSRVLSLFAGYAASILYSEQVAAMLETHYELQGLVGFISAALMLFIGAGVAVSLLFWIIEKLLPEQQKQSVGSSIGGASVGLLSGVVIAFAIIWTFAFVREIGPLQTARAATHSAPSSIEKLANKMAGKAVSSAMALVSSRPEVAGMSSAIIESPAETLQQVQRLAYSDDLVALLNDPANQAVLNQGNAKAVQQLPAFQHLTKNADMLSLAQATGMLDESADNMSAVEADLASQVTDIWGRVQRVKNDKRVQEILNDPAFQQKIQSANPLDMLNNAGLLELANIIFADSGAAPDSAAKDPQAMQGETTAQETPGREARVYIYKWTDENGIVHYSNIESKP